MGRKKPFIEKGEGVKFFLVHRSQKDPLYLDENLGEHVLVPADPETNRNLVESINGLTLSNKSKKSESEKDALKRKRLEEQQKFGIYYEDDYNYLQHLRDVDAEEKVEMDKYETIKIGPILIKNDENDNGEISSATSTSGGNSTRKLQLPSSVFASNFEEDVGYFNQAAPDHDPKINWDPDIVKFLDEDESINFDDADNEMEDDFFLKANSDQIPSKSNKKSERETEEDEDEDEDEGDDDDTETEEGEGSENESDGSGKGFDSYSESQSVKDFETKSKFTSYSMSSSVIKRNDGLRNLDERFEKLFAEYDEDQIGALDTDEIDGYRKSTDVVLEQALEEYAKLTKKKFYTPESQPKKLEILVEKSENSNEESEEDSDSDATISGCENENKKNYETLRFTQKKAKEDRFDCESIVSTYSTLYNHPSVISEKSVGKPRAQLEGKIQLSKKTGLPLGVLTEKPLSKKKLDSIDHNITRILPEIPSRSKNETKEEKKARKSAIKEHRAQRRVEKKINKLAFKHEEAIQVKQNINNPSGLIQLPI